MKRSEAINKAVTEVYETLGITRSKSRAKFHVQVRAAIGVALTPYCTTYEIGDAINRDRSTCSYYTGKHFDNIKHWRGYDDVYKVVKETVDDILQDYLWRSQVESIESRISTLKLTKKRLLKKLEREKTI
tara:strand:+ start:167 stop:556 length:390 start_codon:yes stop_codon:yes gene_type:complete